MDNKDNEFNEKTLMYEISESDIVNSGYYGELAINLSEYLDRFEDKMIIIVRKSQFLNTFVTDTIKVYNALMEFKFEVFGTDFSSLLLVCEETRKKKIKKKIKKKYEKRIKKLEDKLKDVEEIYQELIYRPGNPGMEEAKKEFEHARQKLDK